jgi:hypothetical protein
MPTFLPLFSPLVNPDTHVSRETINCQENDSTVKQEVLPADPTRLDYIGTFQQPTNSRRCRVVGWLRKPGKCIPVYCGRWDCPNCARQKGKKAWMRIKNSPAGEFQRLLTLPFYVGSTRTWQEAIGTSGRTLNAFFVSLRRIFPGFRYVWVREVGKKNNMVHFHVLVDRFLPKTLLSRLWARAGGGYIVDVGQIRTSPSYVSKYLVKSSEYPMEVQIALSGKRRYSASRGLLCVSTPSLAWRGSIFSVVFPPLFIRARVLAVIDGVYYLKEVPYVSVWEGDSG